MRRRNLQKVKSHKTRGLVDSTLIDLIFPVDGFGTTLAGCIGSRLGKLTPSK